MGTVALACYEKNSCLRNLEILTFLKHVKHDATESKIHVEAYPFWIYNKNMQKIKGHFVFF